ncbi:Zinc finger, RING-type [Kalmanozyma brasiliensis GHG001]|uniref:Zinc finger, RING-type n=1 Tax=Kalmanozyma brasiliensis (strain GHG001) TaxID=1365824 RepID=UPI002867BC25|nr:Zinc finger, RING-type [Kalmanozyma brasiliensis GHG001]KAF6767551.1 Zinc finger, RING-type [Kalmanozyma brasiliensis GHG001]
MRISLLLPLLALPAARGSFLGELLFGKDILQPVRDAIRHTEHLRDEVYGWYRHNDTQRGNFTVTPDPRELYKLLPKSYEGRSLVEPDGSYYREVQGWYKGKWDGWDWSTRGNRSLAAETQLNRTAARLNDNTTTIPEYVDGVNATQLRQDRGKVDWLATKSGHIDMRLQEEHLLEGNVSLVTGSISFSSPSSSDSTDFSLEGLHFLPTGSLFLHALAEEDPSTTDVRTSLSLIPTGNNETANQTVQAIEKAFQLRIDMLQRIVDSGTYEVGETLEPAQRKHNCSLHVYGQFLSAGPYPAMQDRIDALEREWVNSTGISTIRAPPVTLSLLAYSPECQLLLHSPTLTGLLQPRFWRKTLHYAMVYFLVLCLQTYLLAKQMQATLTPSGLARQSGATWLLQCFVDAVSSLLHLSVAVGVENGTSGALLACAFMASACFLGFGYRYGIVIWREAMETSSPAPASDGVLTNIIARITGTRVEEVTPEIVRERQRRSFMLAGVTFFLLLGFAPELLGWMMLPVVFSFWIPQIWLNVQRGTRRSVLKRTVVGLTGTRLFLPLYLLICPDNVLFQEESGWGWVLAGWLVGQATLLVGQDVLGPHWFLPSKWVPADARVGWEYHPEEGDAVEGECGICLAPIEKVEEASRDGPVGGWLSFKGGDYDRLAGEEYEVADDAPSCPPEKSRTPRALRQLPPITLTGRMTQRARRLAARAVSGVLRWRSTAQRGRRTDVMRTPCGHTFHTECLERWFEIKGECPSCRAALPPV